MPIELKMPALSPTMTEGNLVKWLKKEGDAIKSGDIIAEIETDKATMELENTEEGTLGKIIIPEGSEGVAVNDLIALILKQGEDASVLKNYNPSNKTSVDVKTPEPAKNVEVVKHSTNEDKRERVFASPLAKRVAESKGIEIKEVAGTGPNGRVIKVDVENFKPSAVNIMSERQGDVSVPHTSTRKVIAKRLLESKTTIPHFYLSLGIDMTEALSFRLKLNKALEKQNIKISVNDLIIKASALALRDFKNVNASFTESHTIMYGNVDISVAVSTDNGLITPIIKNADKKSISQISIEMKELAQKARENKLKPEEFQGGSFSISNLGMFGIENFSAIINPPQSCILAVGGTTKKPIFNEKTAQFMPVDIMEVTLSVDHRIVDGVLGAEFLNKIKFYLENPFMFAH
jgi:pyruvate dehydrogenase E2 component (dihydrolipoamide acetyltransferase)